MKKNSVHCYQYKRRKIFIILESWWQNYSLALFTILNDGLRSWKSTMDCCHVQRCLPIFTLEKKKNPSVYLWSVTVIHQHWKKKKTNRKRTSFYFLFSPLYSLFYIVSMHFCKTDAGSDKSAWHGKLFKRAALNHSSSSCEWQLSDAHSLTVMPLG